MQDLHTPDAGGWRPNKAAVLAASHYVAAIAVVLVWLFPLVWILLTSLKEPARHIQQDAIVILCANS